MSDHAEYWINHLSLQPHPEGGYFREVYRSAEKIQADHLPGRYNGARTMGTAIYYLLRSGECSKLHRLKSDETWHFYRGLPLILHLFSTNGSYSSVRLGDIPENGERYQYTIQAGTWFGVTIDNPRNNGGNPNNADNKASAGRVQAVDKPHSENIDFALAGCTVAPGFDFNDFEMAGEDILKTYPDYRDIINSLL